GALLEEPALGARELHATRLRAARPGARPRVAGVEALLGLRARRVALARRELRAAAHREAHVALVGVARHGAPRRRLHADIARAKAAAALRRGLTRALVRRARRPDAAPHANPADRRTALGGEDTRHAVRLTRADADVLRMRRVDGRAW